MAKAVKAAQNKNTPKSTRTRGFATLALLAVGVALAALGVARGEMADVLQKAVNICLECIGIG